MTDIFFVSPQIPDWQFTRISAILTIQPNTKSLSNPIFGEYSGSAMDGYDYEETHAGIRMRRRYARKNYDEVKLTIPKVVKGVRAADCTEAVSPGEDAIAQIPKYERGQLARIVYHGFYNAPDDVPRPYPKSADFYEAVHAIEAQLPDRAKAAEMLAALTSRLDSLDEMTGISIPSAAQKSGFRSMWTALSACSTIGTIRHSRNKLNFLLNPNPCRRKSHRLSKRSSRRQTNPL